MAPHLAEETALVVLQPGQVVAAFVACDQNSDWDLLMVMQGASLEWLLRTLENQSCTVTVIPVTVIQSITGGHSNLTEGRIAALYITMSCDTHPILPLPVWRFAPPFNTVPTAPTNPHPKLHLNQFDHFSTSHTCDQQTTLHCLCLYTMLAMQPNNINDGRVLGLRGAE